MACPFFMPAQKSEDGGWLHPSRLPLGAGWSGHCCAPGYEGAEPTMEEMRNLCNLGYAAACPRLPAERACDAVRFSVVRDLGARLLLRFVCESGHRPAGHGTLEYHVPNSDWTSRHPDSRIQKMAECYVQSYLQRRTIFPSSGPSTTDLPSSANT